MFIFLLKHAVKNTISSFSAFTISSLCLGFAIFCGTFYIEKNKLLEPLVPSWAKETKALITVDNNVSTKQLNKITAILSVSNWVKNYKVMDQKKAWKNFLKDFSHIRNLANDIDPAYLPTILEITLTKKCLKNSVKCSKFLEDLKRIPRVDSVFSPLPWIKKVSVWFFIFQKTVLFLASFFFLASMIVTVMGLKLAFQSFRKEVYLFDLLGASPWFIKIPFYFQGMFTLIIGIIISVCCFTVLKLETGNSIRISSLALPVLLISMLALILEAILIETTVHLFRRSLRKMEYTWGE